MTCKPLLDGILARHRLHVPDGRALWQYDVLPDEIASLKSFVAGTAPRAMRLADQGALALVACHVQCPDNVQVEWSWALLKSAIPWAADLTALHRNLQQGFEVYWRRPIRRYSERDHRAYLGTCFAEGCLPSLWLSMTHDVGRFIGSLIRRSELYKAPATVLARTRSESFAEGIQSDEIYELCGEIAQVLVALRADLPPGTDAPSRYLDIVRPDWRKRLPLRIARSRSLDTIVDSLLADSGPAEAATPLVEVATLFKGSNVIRRLRVANRISPEQLRLQAGVEDKTAGGLLYLLAQTSSGLRKQIARLEREHDSAGLWRVFEDKKVHEFTTACEVRMIVSLRGEQRGQFTPPGGEALDSSAPWTLALRDESDPTLICVGSGEVPGDRALVCIPETWSAPVPEDEASSIRQSHLPPPCGRVLFEVSGAVLIRGPGESFRVATNAPESPEVLILLGRRLELAGSAEPPYVGPPQVVRRNQNGRSVAVSSSDLQWRRLDGGRWHPFSDTPLGAVAIRTTSGGRARANIVPDDFRVRSDQIGNLRVSARQLEAVVSTSNALKVSRDVDNEFCFSTDDTATTADASLTLCFANATPFAIRVPLHPGRSGFVDEQGQWIPSNAHLSLDRIDSIRARGARNVVTSLDVRARFMSWDWLTNLPAGDAAPSELYLADLRDELTARLRTSGQLDDHLELRVGTLGVQSGQHRALYLGHYWLELREESGERPLRLRAHALTGRALSTADLASLTACRMNLAKPAEAVHPLLQTEPGAFLFVEDDVDPGPYLAILMMHGRVVGRPKLVVVPGERAQAPASSYAFAATRPVEAERREAWKRLCSAMADDWGHAEWLSFHHVLGHGHMLPASTFEFVRAAASIPNFVAAALLRGPDRGCRLEIKRQLEEAGVFWPALPLTSWLAALKALHSHLDAKRDLVAALGGRDAACRLFCPAIYDDNEPELRFIAIVRDLARTPQRSQSSPAPSCLSLPPPVLSVLVSDAKLQLLARHADDTWPQQRVSPELERLADAAPHAGDPAFRRAVLQAPFIAAQLALRGQTLDRRDGWVLRALRSFDSDWFDAAHTLHLAVLVQKNRQVFAGAVRQ